MREPGNILAARIVTLEETPRVIELRGDAAQKISRAYGTTGIITALEMPLAPALPWIDVIVAFDDLVAGGALRPRHRARRRHRQEAACRRSQWPLPSHFAAYRDVLPGGQEPAARHDRRDVARELRDAAGAVRRHRHLQAAGRGRAHQGAALRAHLEPHHAADAQDRPRRHLPAVPLSARPAGRRGRPGRQDVRGRGDAAPRIHPHQRPDDGERHPGGALPLAGAALRDHRRLRVVRHHDRQSARAARSKTAAATSGSMPTSSASSTRSTRWACSIPARCEASCRKQA